MDLRDHALAVSLLAVAAGFAHLALVLRIESRGARVQALVAVALILRLAVAAGVDHGLSDDFHRYLWEGRVVLAGENPYLRAPDDPALAALRDGTNWPNVTHRHVPAAYPPLTLAFFALAAATPRPLLALRVGFVLAELLAWLLLARLLARRGLDPARSLVFGLAPLVVLEYAGSFHFDSLAIAATTGAFLLRARGSVVASLVAIGVAALFKPHALVLAPLLARESAPDPGATNRSTPAPATVRNMAFALAVAVGIFVAGYLPFSSGGAPFAGLLRYADEWSFNAPFFPGLVAGIERLRDLAFDRGYTALPFVGVVARALVESSPDRVARVLLGVAFVLVAARLVRVLPDRERAAAWILAVLLLASPTVQPWYLTWIVPFVAFEPRPSRSPLLWWSVLAPLGYHVIADFREYGVWVESTGWRIAQYAPVLLWIGWRVAAPSTASPAEGADGGAAGGADPRAGSSEASPTQ